MDTGRRASDWLRLSAAEAAEAQSGRDRRAFDRRSSDRRAPRLRLDPFFAATLINHLAPQEAVLKCYEAEKRVRPGIAFDLRA